MVSTNQRTDKNEPDDDDGPAVLDIDEADAPLLADYCRQPVHLHLIADGAPVRATALVVLLDSDGNGVADRLLSRFRGAIVTDDECEAPDMNRRFQQLVAVEAAHTVAAGPCWRGRRLIAERAGNSAV